MKICFYCDSIFSFGGVQRVMSVIAKNLSFKHEVTIITHDNPSLMDTTMYNLHECEIEYKFVKYPKSTLDEFLISKFYSFLYKRILPQNNIFSNLYRYSSLSRSKRSYLIHILNNGDYDIIIGVHAFLSLYLANIKNELKAKVIGWMHSSYDAFFNIEKPYLKDLRKYFFYIIPRLDKIVVLTIYDLNKYLDELKLKVTPIVIYNPLTINTELIKYKNNKTFLSVGRFSHQTKGFDILIKAFALFAKKNQGWRLDIVGDGPEKNYLDSLIEKYELKSKITLHPFTKKIEDYYRNGSIFVLSSRWEGMPLVLLEAMSYGLPIISSDIPVAIELIKDKDFSIFFKNKNIEDLYNKMQVMANKDDKDLMSMSNSAISYVKEFSVDKIVIQWETLLSNL